MHCGFCLPTCPTYSLWGEEMDSPRGRIVLMKAGLEEGPELSAEMVEHWDRCLGCMACVTACPSGVQYDKLIEDTRAQVERNYQRSFGTGSAARLVRALPPPRPPARRGAALASPAVGLDRCVAQPGARRFPRLRALAALAPRRRSRHAAPPARAVRSRGRARGRWRCCRAASSGRSSAT